MLKIDLQFCKKIHILVNQSVTQNFNSRINFVVYQFINNSNNYGMNLQKRKEIHHKKLEYFEA